MKILEENNLTKVETNDNMVGNDNVKKPAKSHKFLKGLNGFLFVLSVLCAIVSVIFFSLVITTDTLGRVIIMMMLFYLPIAFLAVCILSLLFSVLTFKITKSSKKVMIANVIFVLLEIFIIVYCIVLITKT